jgi:hypothetical protein
MGWLRSDDLKEGNNVTAPTVIIALRGPIALSHYQTERSLPFGDGQNKSRISRLAFAITRLSGGPLSARVHDPGVLLSFHFKIGPACLARVAD